MEEKRQRREEGGDICGVPSVASCPEESPCSREANPYGQEGVLRVGVLFVAIALCSNIVRFVYGERFCISWIKSERQHFVLVLKD